MYCETEGMHFMMTFCLEMIEPPNGVQWAPLPKVQRLGDVYSGGSVLETTVFPQTSHIHLWVKGTSREHTFFN